jgi:hypothetical protein
VAAYEIITTEDSTYLEGGTRVVKGFAITFRIPELGEVHTIDVPANNPQEIDRRIKIEVEKYKKLRTLGA